VTTATLTCLRDHLLVQVDAGHASALRPVIDRTGSGLVLVGSTSVAVARRLRDDGFDRPILIDQRRYGGKARARGVARFDQKWTGLQHLAGCSVPLTDSGYVGDGDNDSLRSVLEQTSRLDQPAIALLALHRSWLRRDFTRLIDTVNEFDVPIAVVMEHENDPLSARASVLGLTRLISEAHHGVSVLSCDTSALGALAFGATSAAVGTRSGLRHLYPAKGGGPVPPMESALLRPCLAFYRVGKIAQAVAAEPDEPAWVCWCRQCKGRTVDWLLRGSAIEVRSHSLELLLDLRDETIASVPAVNRMQSWRAACQSAEFFHASIEASGLFWETPPAIRHWQEISIDAAGRVRREARVDGRLD